MPVSWQIKSNGIRWMHRRFGSADNTFDMIVSRNVTWNLEHPDRAYYEWMRVLKPGGVLLNFDANWYHHFI